MPIHPSWEKIMENFRKQYGAEWERIFWSWINKYGYDETKPAEGQIKGEEKIKCEEEAKGWELPPKEWFYNCVKAVSQNPEVENPPGLCAWVWNVKKKKEENGEPELSKEAIVGYIREYESYKTEGRKCENNEGEEVIEEMIYEIVKGIEEFLDEIESSLEETEEEEGEEELGAAS